MADVTISETCCHLETASRMCLITGRVCPFAIDQHRTCADSGFVAHVAVAPDEFKVVVDRNNVPKEGPLAVRKCREEYIYRAAGVYVNNVIGSIEDDAKLEIDFRDGERVELVCRKSEVGLIWRNGKFSPM